MAANPKPLNVWPVVCRSCHERQTVHLGARTGPTPQWSAQTTKCVKCGINFYVIVPDKIIEGPFKQAV